MTTPAIETPTRGPSAEPRAATGTAKKSRWRRRLIRIGLVVLIAVVVFRLTLLILLPTVISRTARAMGLDCNYQRMKLSLLGTNASLWNVEVTSKDGSQQVLKAEYANANLSTLQLLRLRLVAFRLEAEGVSVAIERKADGSIPLLNLLMASTGAKPVTTSSSAGSPQSPSFSSPLEIRALRLYRLAVSVKDETLSPAYEDTIRMDLRVTDLGRAGRPVRIEFDASSRDLFSSATVEASANLGGTKLDADIDLSLRGLRADRLGPYLAPFGLSAERRSLHLRGGGKVSLAHSPDVPGALQGLASLNDFVFTADSDLVASLERVSVDIDSLSPSSLHIGDLHISNGSFRTERTQSGHVRFGAFTPAPFGPASGPAAIGAAPPSNTPPAGALTPSGSPFQWRVDRLTASGLSASFDDWLFIPHKTHTLALTSLAANDLRSRGPADTRSTLIADMAVPGIVGTIRAEIVATPFADEPKASAALSFEAIRPDALEPYLKALGIESTLREGAVTFTLEAAATPTDPVAASFTLDRVVVSDRGDSLFEFGPVQFRGVSHRPDAGLIIDSIHGSGPALNVRRLKDGRLEVVGVRIDPHAKAAPSTSKLPVRPARDTAPATAVAARTQTPRFVLPRVHLKSFTWDNVKLRLDDLNTPDLPPIELTDAEIVARDIRVAAADNPVASPGSFSFRFKAPHTLESLSFNGSLAATTNSLDATVAVRGESLALSRLAPYLAPFGIEPTLTHGAFAADLALTIADRLDGVRLATSARDVSLSDGQAALARVAIAELNGVDLLHSGIAIEKGRVAGLSLAASRNAKGVSLLGLTFVPSAPRSESLPSSMLDPLRLLDALGPIATGSLSAEMSDISWSDSATKSPVRIRAGIEGSVTGFVLNPPPGTSGLGKFDVNIAAPDLADSIAITGTLAASGQGVALNASVRAAGISTEAPAAYLPDGIEAAMDSGELRVDTAVSLAPEKQGSLSALVSVTEFDYRAADDAEPLAALKDIRIAVSSLDLDTRDIHIARIVFSGLTGRAEMLDDGSLRLLGFKISAADGLASAPSPSAVPLIDSSTRTPLTAPVSSVSDVLSAASRPAPLITVDEVAIGVSKLSFIGPAPAAPLSIADVQLASSEPFRLLGADAETNPPAKFVTTGRVDPLIGQFEINVATAPFATHPTMRATISATGINAGPLPSVVPPLASVIDGSPLNNGEFHSTIDVVATVQRRGSSIDFSRGVAIALDVRDTQFSQGDAILAGVGQISADSIRLEPLTGNITAREVEVHNLTGRAWRDESGVSILGLRLKLFDEPAGPGIATVAPTPVSTSPVAPFEAPAAATSPRKPEVRIERLIVSGVDATFDDRAVSPPVTIPITSLDADVRGLSSLLLERERAIRFHASVGAGKVSLPKSAPADAGEVEVEDRDFFSQCFASGTMVFYPTPRGRATGAVSGVELLALRGLAKAVGASIGGGLFDGRIELRAREDGNVDANARLIVTDLRYAEPSSGPAERFMALPVPIDAAIVAVEAPDGTITLSPEVTLSQAGLSTGSLVRAVALAAGQVVATAVLSAPAKVVGGFVGLFGADDPDAVWIEEEPIVFLYANGVTALSGRSVASLHEVLDRAAVYSNVQVAIEHQLGGDDAELIARRTNPTLEQAAALAADLRSRRELLLNARTELLAAASAWAVGVSDDAEPRQRLESLSRQLADVEDSMDELFALQGPGAASAASRRARSGAVELIDARLAAVRHEIAARAGEGAGRIKVVGGRPLPVEAGSSRLVVRVRQRK